MTTMELIEMRGNLERCIKRIDREIKTAQAACRHEAYVAVVDHYPLVSCCDCGHIRLDGAAP